MIPQRSFLHSSVRTVWAGVRPLSCVCAHVLGEMVFCSGSIRTLRASKWLLFGVGAHVVPEIGSDLGGVGTVGTQVLLGGGGLAYLHPGSALLAHLLLLTLHPFLQRMSSSLPIPRQQCEILTHLMKHLITCTLVNYFIQE